jgi:hypothetical protein
MDGQIAFILSDARIRVMRGLRTQTESVDSADGGGSSGDLIGIAVAHSVTG